MAFARVQARGESQTTGSTASLAYVSANTAGNLLVFQAGRPRGSTMAVTDSAGNTWVSAVKNIKGGVSSLVIELFYVENCLGSTNTVFLSGTTGTTTIQLGCAEYSGAATASALLATSTGRGTASTAHATGTVAVSTSALLVAGVISSSASAWTAPAGGWSTLASSMAFGAMWERIANDTEGGSTTPTGGSAASEDTTGVVAVFAVAPSTGAPPEGDENPNWQLLMGVR
jgi:hypothetical protein